MSKVQVNTSYGVFDVEYSNYNGSHPATYFSPAEDACVDIDGFSYVDSEEEYDMTIDELWDSKRFMLELEQAVLNEISDRSQDYEDDDRISAWEARQDY